MPPGHADKGLLPKSDKNRLRTRMREHLELADGKCLPRFDQAAYGFKEIALSCIQEIYLELNCQDRAVLREKCKASISACRIRDRRYASRVEKSVPLGELRAVGKPDSNKPASHLMQRCAEMGHQTLPGKTLANALFRFGIYGGTYFLIHRIVRSFSQFL